jgi:prepilin-type N-terminal cleavage/methylation domain-containing protein
MAARTHITTTRRSEAGVCFLAGQQGFTLVEVLVAILILATGMIAAFGVFSSSKRASIVSQRHEVAVHQAQREIEQIRAYKYSEVALDSTPTCGAPSTPDCPANPKHPNQRLQTGSKLRVKPAGCGGGGTQPCDEDIVVDASNGKVKPGPDEFWVGSGGSAIRGHVYRYVTWRDENCPASLCSGNQDTKRITVAVTIEAANNIAGLTNPVWVSSIVTDPNATVGGTASPQPSPPSTSVQSFYLYDKVCSDNDANNAYAAPGGHHNTLDTASPGTSCENLDPSQRPNLMGPALPAYSPAPVPPYKFSCADPCDPASGGLAGDYPAGLAMLKNSSSCPVSSYTLDTGDSDGDGNLSTPGKYQVHGWATRAFTQDFALSGRAFISLWTTSVGSLPGAGRFCVTLVDRKIIAGVPSDIALGSMSRTYTPWPTTKTEPGRSCGTADFPCGRQLTFQFDLTGAVVRSGGRLMLFISVLDSSDKNLVFLYDDPRYRSFLQVETTTPCTSAGNPCSLS